MWAGQYWQQLVESGKIDVSDRHFEKKKRMMDAGTMRHKDVREIGSEWMCHQALEQLKTRDLLEDKNWEEPKILLALTQIISRAVYPYSEHRTSRWIKENSAVCEITGYNIDKMTKDKLCQSALDLYGIKENLERHLSHRTNELFDLEDKIILYDLTNTYFEGRKTNSKLAKFGRSKEKRGDCKLVILALVVNVGGFIKYSNVFEGSKSDSKSLPDIIEEIRSRTSSEKRAVTVLDAGIATEENCALIRAKGFDYVCVSRAKIKDRKVEEKDKIAEITTKGRQRLSLQRVLSEKHADYIIKVKSEGKELKEKSMKLKFEDRFVLEIEK